MLIKEDSNWLIRPDCFSEESSDWLITAHYFSEGGLRLANTWEDSDWLITPHWHVKAVKGSPALLLSGKAVIGRGLVGRRVLKRGRLEGYSAYDGKDTESEAVWPWPLTPEAPSISWGQRQHNIHHSALAPPHTLTQPGLMDVIKCVCGFMYGVELKARQMSTCGSNTDRQTNTHRHTVSEMTYWTLEVSFQIKRTCAITC